MLIRIYKIITGGLFKLKGEEDVSKGQLHFQFDFEGRIEGQELERK